MRLLSDTILMFIGFAFATHTLLLAKAQQSPTGDNTPGLIAYTNGREVRLIEPDGSNDHVVWTVPDTAFSVSKLAWSPDGREIAFASDHEMAISIYERDIFGIQPDGMGLRKLTNPPLHEELESFAKGTVTVTVVNFAGDSGPYFVYVMGAPEPQQVIISPGTSKSLVFTDVADFGEGAFQHVVVISGIFRWRDAAVAADVIAGTTVNAGTITMTSAIEHEGADGPFWRSDGTRVGFFKTFGSFGIATCIVEQVPLPPPLGFYFDPIFDPDHFETPCAADWAPLPTLADQLLVTDYTDYTTNGKVHVYRVTEASQDKGELVVTFDGYVQVYDIRWLPDGLGFLVAKHDALLERGLNLYEYYFEHKSPSKITEFTGEDEGVRSFSISPDGQFVAFEYVANKDDKIGDVWIMRRDGTDRRLLVAEGASPHWGVQQPSVGVEPAVEGRSSHGLLAVYPQPILSEATLSFHLQAPQEVIMTVYDVLGREVFVRHLGRRTLGEHKASFDAAMYQPGIYFISVVGSAGERKISKVVVLK